MARPQQGGAEQDSMRSPEKSPQTVPSAQPALSAETLQGAAQLAQGQRESAPPVQGQRESAPPVQGLHNSTPAVLGQRESAPPALAERAPVQLVVSQRGGPDAIGVKSAGNAGGVENVGDAEVHTVDRGARARTYGEYVEETLAGRAAPRREPEDALPSGTAIAQLTYQDAAIRTPQVMTKVALNPSNVLGYDLIHAIDPDTNAPAFAGDFGDFLNEAAKFYLWAAYGVKIAAFTTGGGVYNNLKRRGYLGAKTS